MPPGVPLTKEKVVERILNSSQKQQQAPGKLVVHGLVDGLIARAHDLREPEPDDTDREAGESRLKILRPTRESLEPRAQIRYELYKDQRGSPTDHAQRGISQQLRGMNKVVDRYAEQRLVAQEPPRHDHARDGGKNDGPQHARGPLPDDLLNHEQNGGDGSIERRRQPRRRPHGSDQPHLVP